MKVVYTEKADVYKRQIIMNFFVYRESVIPLPEESLEPGEPIPWNLQI